MRFCFSSGCGCPRLGLSFAALHETGEQLETAFAGAKALAAIYAGTVILALLAAFDLLLLDLMLPGVDGFTICRQAREQKKLPILMVSARTGDADKIRGLGFGADDYIEKPFSQSVLVARVKAHLAQVEWLQPSPSTSAAFAKSSRTTRPARSSCRPSGASATGCARTQFKLCLKILYLLFKCVVYP